MKPSKRLRSSYVTACVLITSLATAACGMPSARLDSPPAASTVSPPTVSTPEWETGGECSGDYLDPAEEMADLDSWWVLDVASATSGAPAGNSYDSTATHLNPGGLSSLENAVSPGEPVVVSNEAFSQLQASSTGEGIVGSNLSRSGTQIVHVIAVAAAEGRVKFLGVCTDRFEVPFRLMVEANHPTMSEVDVLVEAARTGDFSEFLDSTAGPDRQHWTQMDPSTRQFDIESTPEAILKELVAIEIEWRISSGWSKLSATLCGQTSIGWNTCLSLEAGDDQESIVLPAYYVPGEGMDLWLLDEEAAFPTPLAQVATITSEVLGASDRIVVEITGQPQTLEQAIDLLANEASRSEIVAIE